MRDAQIPDSVSGRRKGSWPLLPYCWNISAASWQEFHVIFGWGRLRRAGRPGEGDVGAGRMQRGAACLSMPPCFPQSPQHKACHGHPRPVSQHTHKPTPVLQHCIRCVGSCCEPDLTHC